MRKQDRNFKLFLEDIINSIVKIERYLTNFTFEKFSNNEMVIDAVARNLSIIGEASSRIPDEIRIKFGFVEWKKAIGFRNIIVHDYFGVDLNIVWDTIKNDIPKLKSDIHDVLNKIG